jgi:hypothetical protein
LSRGLHVPRAELAGVWSERPASDLEKFDGRFVNASMTREPAFPLMRLAAGISDPASLRALLPIANRSYPPRAISGGAMKPSCGDFACTPGQIEKTVWLISIMVTPIVRG